MRAETTLPLPAAATHAPFAVRPSSPRGEGGGEGARCDSIRFKPPRATRRNEKSHCATLQLENCKTNPSATPSHAPAPAQNEATHPPRTFTKILTNLPDHVSV